MIKIPHSLEAESAVLGTILLRPDAIEDVIGTIQPEDFYSPIHGRIWKAMSACRDSGHPADEVQLLARGIPPEALVAISEVPSVQRIQSYADIVREKASRRQLMRLCDDLRVKCLEDDQSASQLIAGAISAIGGCARSSLQIESEKSVLVSLVEELRTKVGSPSARMPGVPTGLRTIDDMLVYGGLARGHVTTIAARTSQGKSALTQAIKRNAARLGAKVLVITLEDDARANVTRDVSSRSGIGVRQLQRQILSASEWPTFTAAVADLHNSIGGRIWYIDSWPENVVEMLAVAGRHVHELGIELLIIDYLQLVPSGMQHQKEQGKVDYIFDEIVRFSRSHKQTAVILVTQMARHEGPPQLAKLYHSAKLEQGSHTVILIWGPKVIGWPRNGKDLKVLDFAKQKDGPTDRRAIGWDGKTTSFYEPDLADANAYLEAAKKAKE